MKVLQINTVYPYGSTGKIAKALKDAGEEAGLDTKVAFAYVKFGKSDCDYLPVSSWLDNHMHNRLARITMLTGCFSFFHTLFWLNRVKKYNPDIIHIHNLHGNYINIPLLFRYIKKIISRWYGRFTIAGRLPATAPILITSDVASGRRIVAIALKKEWITLILLIIPG